MRYFYSQAGRFINNRELDLDDQCRKEFLKELTKLNAEPELTEVVEKNGEEFRNIKKFES